MDEIIFCAICKEPIRENNAFLDSNGYAPYIHGVYNDENQPNGERCNDDNHEAIPCRYLDILIVEGIAERI